MPPGVNRAPARTVAVPSVPPTRSMLTYERKVFILFGTIVIVLIGNQLLKAVGKAKRNGSLIDRLLADGTMADGLAVSLALAPRCFMSREQGSASFPQRHHCHRRTIKWCHFQQNVLKKPRP